MTMELPGQGRRWEELREEMEAMRSRDLDWRHGRHGAYVWYADDGLEHVLREAFGMFMVENGLGLWAFPSIGRMEREVLAMVQGLLSGDDQTASVFTSGGTESIFVAMYAAREWARAARPGVTAPEIVAAQSAHPALSKAAHLLGMRVKRVPVGPDYRADAVAMESAVGPDTVALYASAPSYSLGLIDPVEAVGAVAARHGLWLHVDACVGGILAPFVRGLGRPVPAFDFAVPGVTSISADLHKSGYAAKPASTINFRTREHREFARYSMDDWPSGTYSSLTFTGTRPGGAIAAAWAAMQYLGRDGYERIAAASMRARDAIARGVAAIPGVRVFGEPELWAFAFGAEGVDMHQVAGLMGKRGWMCGPTTDPRGIHVMCTPVHEGIADEYLAAIAECMAEARTAGAGDASAPRYN
ncbi:MAG: aspartate aminotransferase family protein [Thermoflexaceae bacterium]|nr:aspartate aminotransferase family protein [Thermoflexaceae bacterium]